MKTNRNRIGGLVVYVLIISGCSSRTSVSPKDDGSYSMEDSIQDRSAIIRTGDSIRSAFQRGDVTGAMAYHHPEVIKSFGYNQYVTGRDSVEAMLTGTLKNYTLEFVQNDVESILVSGGMAVEETLFTIRGTPKLAGDPFLFKGRTMVVYVKDKQSPTGWVTIRELVQPAK
jgi:ketosteroid isomerase-like protein